MKTFNKTLMICAWIIVTTMIIVAISTPIEAQVTSHDGSPVLGGNAGTSYYRFMEQQQYQQHNDMMREMRKMRRSMEQQAETPRYRVSPMTGPATTPTSPSWISSTYGKPSDLIWENGQWRKETVAEVWCRKGHTSYC